MINKIRELKECNFVGSNINASVSEVLSIDTGRRELIVVSRAMTLICGTCSVYPQPCSVKSAVFVTRFREADRFAARPVPKDGKLRLSPHER